MVTLGESFQDEVASDKSLQRKNLDSGYREPQPNQEGNALSVFPEKEMGESQKTRPDAELTTSRCNEEGNNSSTIAEKSLKNVEQKNSSDSTSRDQTSQSSQEGIPHSENSGGRGVHYPIFPEKNECGRNEGKAFFKRIELSHIASHSYGLPARVLPRQSPDSTTCGVHNSVANQDGTSVPQTPERAADNLQQRHRSNTGDTSHSNGDGSSLSAIPEKVPDCLQPPQSANTELHLLQCDQEGRKSSRIPDKVSQDGYNWRKYGQKLVKGNEFVRSYYRCTHPNCPAKRQVERSQGGQITDTVYLGKHEHPKPQPSPQMAAGLVVPIKKKRDEPSLAAEDDKSSDAHDPTSHHVEPAETPRLSTSSPDRAVGCAISQSNRAIDAVDHSGIPDSKRQKNDICNSSETLVEKPNGEPRRVVQSVSGVDIVNDGYRWRKYGQKYVKGNANPRSYYRCSTASCSAKKHVERASHDPKVVITTYEGQHAHNTPPARTVTVNTAGADSNVVSLNGESRSTPDEKSSVGLEKVVHASAN